MRICSYCKKTLIGQQVTKDHIVPKRKQSAKVRRSLASQGIMLTRPSCIWCNMRRVLAGDCVGVLFCAFAVAEERGSFSNHPSYRRRVGKVLGKWNLRTDGFSNKDRSKKDDVLATSQSD